MIRLGTVLFAATALLIATPVLAGENGKGMGDDHKGMMGDDHKGMMGDDHKGMMGDDDQQDDMGDDDQQDDQDSE